MSWTEDEYQEYLKSKGKEIAKDKPKRKPKYNNKKTWIDGYCFDSQKEGDYYSQLKVLLKAGAIKGFCVQPEFILVEGNEEIRAITYKADFITFHLSGKSEIIDTKGFESEQWRRTYKQFRLKYPNLELNIIK